MEILVNPSHKLKFFLGLKIDNECKIFTTNVIKVEAIDFLLPLWYMVWWLSKRNKSLWF